MHNVCYDTHDPESLPQRVKSLIELGIITQLC